MGMHPLGILGLFALVTLAVAKSGKHSRKDDAKPNIIWLFADDYGYSDVGFRNNTVHSPNMDDLATNGIIFTNAYTAPTCSPSRGSFLSGRYPFRIGMQHGVILDSTPSCMPLEFKLLPKYMKDLGYNTHAFGKWHLGYCRKECTPLGRGFDTFNGGFSGEGEYLTHTTFGANFYDWHVGDEPDHSADGVHSQDLIQKYVLETLDGNDGTPFFMYVAFHNTHSPLDPKEEFLSLYDELDAPESRKKYLGLVSGMDFVIGEIVKKLKDLGMYDNTYILFSSDNGGDVAEADNSPKRGGKSSLWDGGVHANSWAHSPLLEASGVENDGLFHITDWLPTIVSMGGGSVPDSDGLDGLDQSEMVTKNGKSVRTSLFYNIDREDHLGPPACGAMAVRNEWYKLIWGFEGRNDGYGTDIDFMYHQKYVKDEVDAFYAAMSGTDKKKRGGPYILTNEENYYLNGWMAITDISAADFEAGTGHMHLFDLVEDPKETTDLADSDKEEHKAAKAELIKMIQDAVNADSYYKMEERYTLNSKLFTAPNKTLTVGWCETEFP